MKSILTIVFVIFLGVFAQAQNNTAEVKVEVVEMNVVLVNEIATDTVKENTLEVVRLYRRANSQVKKALSFYTKRNRSKMA